MKDIRGPGDNIPIPLGTLPIRCFFKSSAPRYKGKKPPVPKTGAMVSLEGFLFEVTKQDGGLPERFSIMLENINFMGRSTVPPRPKETPGSKFHYF
jgi:hypothetical protein